MVVSNSWIIYAIKVKELAVKARAGKLSLPMSFKVALSFEYPIKIVSHILHSTFSLRGMGGVSYDERRERES